MAFGKKKILGVGSALLDILANVEDGFLKNVEGEKGGMVMIDAAASDRLCRLLPSHRKVIGGSAANTIAGLQRLGMATAMLGKVGTAITTAVNSNAWAATFPVSSSAPMFRPDAVSV